jgi:hypothetical protein
MTARDVLRPISRQSFDDCLSWRRVGTPFIPFTSNWHRALARKRRLVAQGADSIVIIAVLTKGLPDVYDAYEAAQALGYRDVTQDTARRLSAHEDEYLVWKGISAETDRILAVFDGQGPEAQVEFRLPGWVTQATARGFLTGVPGNTATDKLKNELRVRTGVTGDSQQLVYLVGWMTGMFNARYLTWMSVIPCRNDVRI